MNVDANNIVGMVMALIRGLPAFLAYIVMVQLAWGRFNALRAPITPVDAAYTLIAVAAFAYVLRV